MNLTLNAVLQLLLPLVGMAVLFGALRNKLEQVIENLKKFESKLDAVASKIQELEIQNVQLDGRLKLIEYQLQNRPTSPGGGPGSTGGHPTQPHR